MKRRDFILGAGATAAGGATLLNSGAFTSVEAERSIVVETADDADALLELAPCEIDGETQPNGQYAVEDGGLFAIDFSEVAGDGVNIDAVSRFHNVFQVCNRGTQSVCVDFQVDVAENAEGDPAIVFYRGADEDAVLNVEELDPDQPAGLLLEVGDCECIGFKTRTQGFESSKSLLEDAEVTIRADADADCEAGVPPEEEPGIELEPNADPEEELESQFDILTDEEFGTNAVEVCVEKAGVEGSTSVGVQVTDHHGTFEETPTTWNPGSSFLAPVNLEFEDGEACFTIGNPGVDGVDLTLFPFDGGLETVDDIENIAVDVDGEEPDRKFIRGVDLPDTSTSTSSGDDEQPFTEYEAER